GEGMTITPAVVPPATITQRLIGLAPTRPGQTALVRPAAGTPGRGLSYPSLGVMLQEAAAGLAWHGLRRTDVVGVHVADAASFAIAVPAIRAGRGVPSP